MLFTRHDGTKCTDIAPTRAIMPFIMPTRSESAVYFEQWIDLTKTLAFLETWNAANPERKATTFHVFLWAATYSIDQRPRLNRFVIGSRIWQRHGIHLSYAAKKRLEDGAPLVVLKRKFDPSHSFAQLVDFVYADVKEGRSDKKNHVDKELNIFLRIPAPILRIGVGLVRWLDAWNLLPRSFIDPDPLYCSMFVANLGSVKLDSAYHHLYEYGNCPFFAALGRTQTIVTPDGPKQMCSIKYSFDERVEDGLYCAKGLELLKQRMEDPAGGGTPA
ncbi:MAG: hypothetical protein Q8L14_03820 [Myxococcales bacterium]|nr:hypothetical protein [Myxococcales bacterium]